MEKLVSSQVKHWVQMSKTHYKGKSLQQIIVLSFLYKSTRASWNKTFKQVLSFFFPIVTSALLILWAAFYTYLKSEETIFEFVEMLLQAFSDTTNWVYKKTQTSIPNGLKISLASSIFLTTIEYGTSSSSIN